jgi:hypothetical protein
MNKHIRLNPGAAFGMAMLSRPTLATAQSIPITFDVLSPATVVAKGAGVDVTIQISCSSPRFLRAANRRIETYSSTNASGTKLPLEVVVFQAQ